MISMGIDIGSSSVKVAILDTDSGATLAMAQYPDVEMKIHAPQLGWAEQEPESWYEAFKKCLLKIKPSLLKEAKVIGISYQMHGLVCLDKDGNSLRPAIIWCDSRAVEIGNKAFQQIGQDRCLNTLLNSPGNFTASKLKWVQENQPDIYSKIDKVMLPGDFLAYRLTGEISTTITGLSEGILWDFEKKELSKSVLEAYDISSDLIPEAKESFAIHGKVLNSVASDLGLNKEAIISYKGGDQPNNALSLNVTKPGEVAATAGTSGVVYAVTDKLFVDNEQKVNGFAHVNYTQEDPMIGVLLCINGVGIANSWINKITQAKDYISMNERGGKILPGAEGVRFLPFGNGAERMLGNQEIGAHFSNLNFNIHNQSHMFRAVQEGIAFAFYYGMESFIKNDLPLHSIKAGSANMFLSPLFSEVLCTLSGVEIELYNTDGALGAARGASIGSGDHTIDSAFSTLNVIRKISPSADRNTYKEIFSEWKEVLESKLLNYNSN